MEDFYNYLKDVFFVENDLEEIRDISAAVDTLLHRYMDFMNKEDPSLSIERLLSGGSMVEGTRIWEHLNEQSRDPDLEFDYLAVLRRPSSEMQFERSCLGHMRVISDTDVDSGKQSSVNLTSVIIQFWKTFVAVVMKMCSCFQTIEEPCKPFAFTISLIKNTQGCEICTVTQRTGKLRLCVVRPEVSADRIHPLKFEWISVEKSLKAPRKGLHRDIRKQTLDTVIIHADFLPAFEVRVPNRSGNAILGQRSEHDCFLVPKHCQQHQTCWRISYCLSEINILQNTTQSHRDIYKIFKIFQSLFKTGLKSYHIKTAVLHHISSCRNEQGDRHKCLVETLDFLVKGMVNRSMPHTIEGLNLRDVFSEHSLYLYQAQIFYSVLNSSLGLISAQDYRYKKTKHEETIEKAFVSECGNALFDTARRVLKEKECYDEFLAEIIKLGEWVSKKRVNEYRDIDGDICVLF